MTSEMQVREVIEEQRYQSYYGIDLSDRSIYDLAINTGRWNTEATLDLALTAIEGYDVESDEGAFDTPDFEIWSRVEIRPDKPAAAQNVMIS